MTGPASGIAAKGRSKHGPDCDCQRCRRFAVGNGVALKHGVHALVELAPAAERAREFLEATLPQVEKADAALLSLMAMDFARLLAAAEWRTEHGWVRPDGTSWPFEVDIAKVANRFARCCERFGGSPAARVELGAIFSRNLLDEYVSERYGDARSIDAERASSTTDEEEVRQ